MEPLEDRRLLAVSIVGPMLEDTSDSVAADAVITSQTNSDVSTVYNVKEVFGAVGDGATNDTWTIWTALNYVAANGGTLYFPAGRYLCNPSSGYSITCLADVTLQGEVDESGESLAVIDFTSCHVYTPLVLSGVKPPWSKVTWVPKGTDDVRLGTDITEVGTTTITVPESFAATLSPGDTVLLTTLPYRRSLSTYNGSIAFEAGDTSELWSTARYYYYKGEYVTVASVDGTTVTLTEGIRDTYTGANTSLYRLSSTAINVVDLTIQCNTDVQWGLGLAYCVGGRIENVTLSGARSTGIELSHAVDYVVQDNFVYDVYVAESGTQYGISICSCQDVVVTGNTLLSGRHALAHGGEEPCRDILITNNYLQSTRPGTRLPNYALDFHGNCEDVTVTDNTIDGGIGCQAINATICNNQITIYGDGTLAAVSINPNHSASYINILNNTMTLLDGTTWAQPVVNAAFSEVSNITIDTLLISGNTIEDFTGAVVQLYQSSTITGGRINNIRIEDNPTITLTGASGRIWNGTATVWVGCCTLKGGVITLAEGARIDSFANSLPAGNRPSLNISDCEIDILYSGGYPWNGSNVTNFGDITISNVTFVGEATSKTGYIAITPGFGYAVTLNNVAMRNFLASAGASLKIVAGAVSYNSVQFTNCNGYLVVSRVSPEIYVTGMGVSIVDDDTSPSTTDGTNFGATVQNGTVITRTFVVRNTGSWALTVGSLILPDGFTLVEGLSPTIASGSSDTFTVRLDTDTVGTFAGEIIITNDDTDEGTFNFAVTGTVVSPPSMSIGDAAIAEGDSGTTILTFLVTLSEASPRNTTVTYAAFDGTAVAGEDYTAASGSLTILAGTTTGTISVVITGDNMAEQADENFYVRLTNARFAAIIDGEARGTILNDDIQALVVSAASLTVPEAGTASFTVALAAEPLEDTVVTITNLAGSGSGLSADVTTLTFTAANWSTPQTVTIAAAEDANANNEKATFEVASSGLSTWYVATKAQDDEPAPVVSSWEFADDTGESSADQVTSDTTPVLRFTFSEIVLGQDDYVVVLDPNSNPVLPDSIAGWGTNTLTLTFSTPLVVEGQYTVVLQCVDGIANESGDYLNGGDGATYYFLIDTVSATTPITSQADSGAYNATGWADQIAGTVVDGSGVVAVEVSICDSEGNYWDGSGFNSSDELFLPATGTTDWTLEFANENFSTEGWYTIRTRATDLAGNVGIGAVVTFVYDTTAPTLTWGEPVAPNAAGWYNGDVSVPFTAEDALSGVAGCSSTDVLVISVEGTGITGTVTVTDAAGNTATFTSAEFNIDKTAPTLTWGEPNAPNAAGWYNGDVSVPFTVGDALSGVVESEPGDVLVISVEGAGVTGTVTVTDAAGNTATFTSAAFNIDKTDPIVTVATSGTYNAAAWTGQITGTAADNTESGIAVIEVSIRNSAGKYWDGDGFDSAREVFLPATGTTDWTLEFANDHFPADGQYTIRARAIDLANHVGVSSTATIVYDTTAPTLIWGEPTAPNAAGWNNTNVTVPFTVVDAFSGVAACSSIDALVITVEGSGVTGTVTVTDAAGNTATFVSAAFNIDKTAPTLAWGEPTAANAAGWNNTNVIVPFTAADSLSGVAACSSTDALVITVEGSGVTGTVTVTDVAGNSVTFTSASFKIDKTAPASTITFPADLAAYSKAQWGGRIAGTAEDDAGSGVGRVEVSIRSATGTYWDGDGFDSKTEVFFTAAGAADWTLAFSANNLPASGDYVIHARAVDVAGNVEDGASVSTMVSVPVHDFTTIGLYNPDSSTFYLRNANSTGYADVAFMYGAGSIGWMPLVGDWDGDGVETIGLYDPTTSRFFLKNSNGTGYADASFTFGAGGQGWMPLVGDWNGDGVDTVGLYDPVSSTFYLRNKNSTGYADVAFAFGAGDAGWTPIVGDWLGTGVDTIGLYDPSTATFYLKYANSAGYADNAFVYGPAGAGWTPIVGDWQWTGIDTIGLYDPATSTFYLRNHNSPGYADAAFAYGAGNMGWTPILGDWNGASLALTAEQSDSTVSADAQTLTQSKLDALVDQTIQRWIAAGLDAALIERMEQMEFTIADLPGSVLGLTNGNDIYIDSTAAGYGWFVDATPAADEEFAFLADSDRGTAIDSRAVDQIDLLTVIEHELGHSVGLGDLDALADDVMSGTLGAGVRVRLG